MSGAICPKFPECCKSTNEPRQPCCDRNDCPGKPQVFYQLRRVPNVCDHDFTGWRDFEDGSGGEQVCSKCGMGAMEYTLRTGP